MLITTNFSSRPKHHILILCWQQLRYSSKATATKAMSAIASDSDRHAVAGESLPPLVLKSPLTGKKETVRTSKKITSKQPSTTTNPIATPKNTKALSNRIDDLLCPNFQKYNVAPRRQLRWSDADNIRLLKIMENLSPRQVCFSDISLQFPGRTASSVYSHYHQLLNRSTTFVTRLTDKEVLFIRQEIDTQRAAHSAALPTTSTVASPSSSSCSTKPPLSNTTFSEPPDTTFRIKWEPIARRLGRRGSDVRGEYTTWYDPTIIHGEYTPDEIAYMTHKCHEAALLGKRVNWTECARHLRRQTSFLHSRFKFRLYR
ncbi:hypothetical protein BASA61_000615 [Batrachochytrium salamandrivorans]|nr:hypothetical protein BASA61_000615 [Batrachochytrium salamandrivorans]KAH9270707.1 hypothetical protein BASA83_007067 [Batrachochytrium salamandrivorans]